MATAYPQGTAERLKNGYHYYPGGVLMGVSLGASFPELRFPTLDNDAISIADYSGKRVLLFVWASW